MAVGWCSVCVCVSAVFFKFIFFLSVVQLQRTHIALLFVTIIHHFEQFMNYKLLSLHSCLVESCAFNVIIYLCKRFPY